MNLLTIRNGNISYFGQIERYASSGDFVYIFFARASIVSVILSFFQLHRQRKMAARFFLHGDHHAKVVPSGMPLLRPVQYHRTFLDSVQYENLLHVFTNANSMEPFSGYIIIFPLFQVIAYFVFNGNIIQICICTIA